MGKSSERETERAEGESEDEEDDDETGDEQGVKGGTLLERLEHCRISDIEVLLQVFHSLMVLL